MKKEKSILKIIREIKNAMHKEWVKNPAISTQSLIGSVDDLNRRYGRKSHKKQAA